MTDTEIVSPAIHRPTNEPITANGNENKIANGATPSRNVTTRMKYTIAIAASIAKPSCVNVSVISAAAPATSTVTPLGKSNFSIASSTSDVAFEISSPRIVAETVA